MPPLPPLATPLLICSDYKLLLFANRLLGKYMYILICQPALTSLYVMMLIEKHYKHHTTALIRYSSDLKSISNWMLKENKKQFH